MPETPLLQHILRPLAVWYTLPGIEEIAINQPQEVWVKRVRKGWEVHPAPELTYEYLAERLCYVLANVKNVPFRRDMPIVACEIAGDDPNVAYRFQAIVGPNVRYRASDSKGVAICVRVLRAGGAIGLEAFFTDREDGSGKTLRKGVGIASGETELYSDDPMEDLCLSVSKGKSILVSGPTATGKTTFVGNLIQRIPLDTRVCTFQDALELDVPHPNRVMLLAPRSMISGTIGYGPLLDSIVRLTPDVIIAGEISIDNAAPIARILTMGHASFMSTIHAGSCDEAVEAFVQNMALKGGSNVDHASMVVRLKKAIARRVQIDRFGGERSVVELKMGGDH